VSLVAEAVALADSLHAAQLDKGGEPYIGHPLRVMGEVRAALEKENAALGPLARVFGLDEMQAELEAVAVLHDVIEDCGQSVASLLAAGMPLEVCERVSQLSLRQGEPYEAYIDRLILTRDQGLYAVKLADLLDNLDPARLDKVAPRLRRKLERRYTTARDALLAAAQALNSGSSASRVVLDAR
jgi:(p)ppGpp synthase/HD superfamily hydrolase